MTQTIDNGNYDVYFRIGENNGDNARSIDLRLEGGWEFEDFHPLLTSLQNPDANL